ncbi:MAG: hypothetical protein BME94_05885 [Methanobacteriales archaeon Met13]
MQVFTPRKPGSMLSKSNKKRVEKLIKQGRLTPVGMEKIEAAKKDGSWHILDDVEDLILPEDLKKVFEQNKKAEQHFQKFNVSSKKQILWWIASAEGPETRKRRIKKVVDLAPRIKLLKLIIHPLTFVLILLLIPHYGLFKKPGNKVAVHLPGHQHPYVAV